MDNDAKTWHALSTAETLTHLKSRATGLTQENASQRLKQYGKNRLVNIKRRNMLVCFFSQFNNVLIYILLLSAFITALLQHWVDCSVILAVVLVNAIIGALQEGKAEKALDAIKNMLSPVATVFRNNKRQPIDSQQLVPGDVIYLQAGDLVPADARILTSKNLQVQESILTGESNPVNKAEHAVEKNSPLAERYSMVYSGTLVNYGFGTAIIVATADNTEIGHINSLLATVKTITTPLLQKLDSFGKVLTIAIVMIATISYFFGVFIRDYNITDMFMAAVGLAVAAIPEGLPAILTITLAIGVTRMAKRHAIIRRLPAVETMGSITVVCSDKTGTLTRNEQAVQEIITSKKHYSMRSQIDALKYLNEEINDIIQASVLCNDAERYDENQKICYHGNPMDVALMSLAGLINYDIELIKKNFPQTDMIPFESSTKIMATLHHDHRGGGFTLVKGAPENILACCSRQRCNNKDEPLDADYWHHQIHQFAKQGQRMLAIATKKSNTANNNLTYEALKSDFTILGLIGFIDPPRKESKQAIQACRQAGINVLMITGDHETTAKAIAKEIGIANYNSSLSGKEIDHLDDASLDKKIATVNVFSRTTPEHKLRILQSLKRNGHVTAMTGDGVNDAPALKYADVGVAMGLRGTEVAKEASEIVIADDNFASIVHAIEEGRTVYNNIEKAILFILPTNGGQAFCIITAILFGTMLPITPLQILWVNMITAVTLALSLAFEPAEDNIMKRQPRTPKQAILSGFLIWRIFFVTILMVIGTFGLFLWTYSMENNVELARTIAINTLVFGEIFYLFNSRKIYESTWSLSGLFGSKPIIIAICLVVFFQISFTYLPIMHHFFGTTSLDAMHWLPILIFSLLLYLTVEVEKKIIAKYFSIRTN